MHPDTMKTPLVARRAVVRLALACAVTGLVASGVVAVRAAQPAPAQAPGGLADLARAFRTPPDEARVMMRWWWFGPTVTRSGIERDLQAMRDGGLGGVEIQPVYPLTLDDPSAGLVTHPFLSAAFLDDVKFAAATARRLGLRADLTLGSGWPYGGPQVGVTQAAGRLRVDRVTVAPGETRVVVPDVRTGERLIGAFLAPRPAATSADGVRELRDVAEGVVRLPDAAAAPREVLFFFSSRTGMMVKRASVGAEGFVLDHYDRRALDHYLQTVGTPLAGAFGDQPPASIFCDSLEVFDSDWTPDFLAAFQAKRGYDLRPLLPALALDAGPLGAGLRHDWGQTLTELVREQFIDPMAEWAHSRQSRFRLQGYGIPPATISSNANVDLPEGEGAQWKTVRASRWAASIGHVYGRPVISSETWTWLHSPVFRATPLDVKMEADLHFLQGINQLVGHGWPYTADGIPYPGWRFYAAGALNDKNPWWLVMPDLARYLQRLSYLLRQGQPINDVALYLPVDDAWAHFAPGRLPSFIDTLAQRVGPDLMPAIIGAGYNLDFVDDAVLRERGRAEGGALVIGQNRYRAIVLPAVERMSPETMRTLEAFAAQGVRVVAVRRTPGRAPGHLATDADDAAVRAGSDRLFRGAAGAGAFATSDADVAPALKTAVAPDMAVTAGANVLGVVHRRTADADVYFVANTSNQPVAASATFRVAAGRAEQWNPLTGASVPCAVRPAPARDGASPGSSVSLDLEPYGSTVFVFSSPASGAAARFAAATPSATADTAPFSTIDLRSGWQVQIQGASAVWPSLRSWTDAEETRFFSGVATYQRQVDVPAALLSRGRAVWLDFGEPRATEPGGPNARVQAWLDAPVREAAVVSVNGVRVGSVWCPPYRLDVTAHLRPGTNSLRIDVANLAINAMAGRALPDYRLLNLRYGSRFDPQDMDQVKPLPSGLLGPVRLVSRPGTHTSARSPSTGSR
jgi:hypothetical protein